MYQNKNYTHNMLHYRTTHKPITLYDQSDLNMWKMKMFVNTLAKNWRQVLEYMGIPYKSL